MPHYLPDGRIVFSSTRQRQSRAILLDENKPQFAAQDENDNEPAFVLHVMNADGTNIHQISFNQSHDLDPAVLANGRILFTRWEHHIDDNQFDLYTRQSGRFGSAAVLRCEQSCDRHSDAAAGHHQQHHSVPEPAPDAGRPHAVAGPSVHRHR